MPSHRHHLQIQGGHFCQKNQRISFKRKSKVMTFLVFLCYLTPISTLWAKSKQTLTLCQYPIIHISTELLKSTASSMGSEKSLSASRHDRRLCHSQPLQKHDSVVAAIHNYRCCSYPQLSPPSIVVSRENLPASPRRPTWREM